MRNLHTLSKTFNFTSGIWTKSEKQKIRLEWRFLSLWAFWTKPMKTNKKTVLRNDVTQICNNKTIHLISQVKFLILFSHFIILFLIIILASTMVHEMPFFSEPAHRCQKLQVHFGMNGILEALKISLYRQHPNKNVGPKDLLQVVDNTQIKRVC